MEAESAGEQDERVDESHSGGCLCGAVRYEIVGPPAFKVKCYCRHCQQLTGGGHAPQIAFERKALSFDGPVAQYECKADSGSDLTFSFCKTCGVCVFKFTTKLPDLVFVPAGSLDDPSLYEEQHIAYASSRLEWDH